MSDNLEFFGIYQTTVISQTKLAIKFRIFDVSKVSIAYLYLPIYNITIEGDLNKTDGSFSVYVKDITKVYPYPTMKCSTIVILGNGDKHTYGSVDLRIVEE